MFLRPQAANRGLPTRPDAPPASACLAAITRIIWTVPAIGSLLRAGIAAPGTRRA